ncbi:MAG: cache domain-containing protein [Sulfurimonas sp.]|nr:cache domain-containing protein [Sulfurimonas sp.]
MKKIILISSIFILYAISVTFYAMHQFKEKEKETYIKLSNQLKNELNNEKRFSKDIGIINAISIAEDINIKKALLTNNRELAIETLQKIEKDFSDKTSIKHLKVHIHTKDTRAFVRSWKLAKHGDDLTAFRKAIVEVRMTKEPFFGFEVGRMGLTLRSIVPVLDNGNLLGTLEFIQNFDKILKRFKRKEYSYLLLIDKSLLNIAKYLKDAPLVGPYVLSSKKFDLLFLRESQIIDFTSLKENGYYVSDKYFYTYEEIKDTQNTIDGMHLLAMPIKNLTKEIDSSKKDIIKNIATQTLFLFLILGIIAILYLLISSSRSSK